MKITVSLRKLGALSNFKNYPTIPFLLMQVSEAPALGTYNLVEVM